MNTDFNIKVYFVFAIVFTAVLSFFLGGIFVYKLIAVDEVEIQKSSLLENIVVEDENRVYASKSGKKYYPWWCDAGSRIKEENKIWFENKEEAIDGGYSLASNC